MMLIMISRNNHVNHVMTNSHMIVQHQVSEEMIGVDVLSDPAMIDLDFLLAVMTDQQEQEVSDQIVRFIHYHSN
jgi:hypothetical protein